MRRKWVALCMVCFAFFVSVSQAAASPEKTKTPLRLETAGQRLQSLVVDAPTTPVRALISFRAAVRVDDALRWAAQEDLEPIALYHAYITQNNTFRGGYVLLPGESHGETVAHYSERYRSLLTGYANAVQRLLENPPGNEKGEFGPKDQSVQQLTTKLNDLRSQLEEFDRSGSIPIYGVEVIGAPRQLMAFGRKHAQLTRLVEPLEDKQPAVPLLPND